LTERADRDDCGHDEDERSTGAPVGAAQRDAHAREPTRERELACTTTSASHGSGLLRRARSFTGSISDERALHTIESSGVRDEVGQSFFSSTNGAVPDLRRASSPGKVT
jgi:hypothetical protein